MATAQFQAMETSTAVKPKQRRVSTPKVKTGCSNCKLRRVKCDETRPQCNKCVRAGRICEGYPAARRTTDTPIAIAPRDGTAPTTLAIAPSASSTSSPLRNPPFVQKTSMAPTRAVARKSRQSREPVRVKLVSPTIRNPGGFGFSAQEGQYFQVFRTHTANELSGFFDSEFWTRSVLQESHSEASIRHAVVALGALYKTLDQASESPPGSPEDSFSTPVDTATTHYHFAVQQYGKAIVRLQESLANKETQSQRTALISIVLFTCFESFTGAHKEAIVQIQHGLALLEERRQDSTQPLIQRRLDMVEDELIQMFTRLAVQAKSYDMAFHFPQPYVIQLSPQPRHDSSSPQSPSSPSDATSTASMDTQLPARFETSKEARVALDALTERLMQFHEQLSSIYQGPNHILPKSIKSFGYGFGVQLKQWGDAFTELLETRRSPGITNTERACINVLKMFHEMTSILFNTTYSTSEMEFDNFTERFSLIVDLAGEVVLDEELTLAQARCGSIAGCRHTNRSHTTHHLPGMTSHQSDIYREQNDYSHIKASFALDIGIVPPLFVVATKCRNRHIRRKAIKLLLAIPRREGMWDSLLCGRAAQWVMDIEEQGLAPWHGPFDPSAHEIVPDEQRVMIKEIWFDMQRREAMLKCGTRGLREHDVDVRAKEQNIWW